METTTASRVRRYSVRAAANFRTLIEAPVLFAFDIRGDGLYSATLTRLFRSRLLDRQPRLEANNDNEIRIIRHDHRQQAATLWRIPRR